MPNSGREQDQKNQEVSDDQYVDNATLKKQVTKLRTSRLDYDIMSLGGERALPPTSPKSEDKNFTKSPNRAKSYYTLPKVKVSAETNQKNKQLKNKISQYIQNVEIYWTHHQYEKEGVRHVFQELLDNEFKKKLFTLCKLKGAKYKELFDLLKDISIDDLYNHTIAWMKGFLQSEKYNTEESFINDYINSIRVFVKAEKQKLEAVELRDAIEVKPDSPPTPRIDSNKQETTRDKNNNTIQEIRRIQKTMSERWEGLNLERANITKEWEEECKYKLEAKYSLPQKLLNSPLDSLFKELLIYQFGVKGLELDDLPEIKNADAHDVLKAVNIFIEAFLKKPFMEYASFRPKYAELLKTFPNHDIDLILTPPRKEKIEEEKSVAPLSRRSSSPEPELSVWERFKAWIKSLFCCWGGGESKPQPRNISAASLPPAKASTESKGSQGNFCSSLGRLFCIFGRKRAASERPAPEPMVHSQIFTQVNDHSVTLNSLEEKLNKMQRKSS